MKLITSFLKPFSKKVAPVTNRRGRFKQE